MARLIELADFRPSRRHDGNPWTGVRVEHSDDAEAWEPVGLVVDLEPVDQDPTRPQLRSISTESSKAWLRLVFTREQEEDEPSVHVYGLFPSFRPRISDISSILRARTYSGAETDPKNPMAVLAGGAQLGEFDESSRPTRKDLEDQIIPNSARDVALELGAIPGELIGEARRVTAFRAATEAERSYIPEQSDESKTIYQTLRLTYEAEVGKLASTLQWWVLANRKAPQQVPWLWCAPSGMWLP